MLVVAFDVTKLLGNWLVAGNRMSEIFDSVRRSGRKIFESFSISEEATRDGWPNSIGLYKISELFCFSRKSTGSIFSTLWL